MGSYSLGFYDLVADHLGVAWARMLKWLFYTTLAVWAIRIGLTIAI